MTTKKQRMHWSIIKLTLTATIRIVSCIFTRIISLVPGRLKIYIIFSSLLTACSGDNSDLEKYIYTVKNKPGKAIEPMPKFAPLAKFKYPENDARRSPFKPIELTVKRDEFTPDRTRKKQELETFPLDALKYVGTLKEGSLVWGLIKQPNGKIDRVRIGDYMGENFGRIVSINDNVITLEEAVKESGKWLKRKTIFNLDVSGK